MADFQSSWTRRRLLTRTLFGAGLVGLRSLATGIPIAILANPRKGLAAAIAEGPAQPARPQYVILSTSGDGDPMGCNVPGTYADPAILHPSMPSMAPTALTLGGERFLAARPWAELPQALLDRTCFFHHATYTVVHSEEQKTLCLAGKTEGNEMWLSLLAAQLAPALGTIQAEPIVLGPRQDSEGVVFQRRVQPIVAPSALAQLLGAPTGPLGQFTQLRDRDLDRLNSYLKREGTRAQRTFIDQYVQSQSQLRSVSETLLSVLQSIKDDSVSSQILAAVTLIRMKVSPVISLHVPFGADNHSDPNLEREAKDTVSGVASFGELWSQLTAHGLQDSVSFLAFNVFGRPLSPAGRHGRDHSASHNVAVMFGAPFRGSVVGGVERFETDFGASSIDSATGRAVGGEKGDVRFADTLNSMAVTFTRGVGVNVSCLGKEVAATRQIGSALQAG